MRGARIGEGIGFVCVGIGGVQVLVWSDVRISDGLRAEASIEGLLEQIRSSNLEAGEGKSDLDDSDVRDWSAEKAVAEIGYWHDISTMEGFWRSRSCVQ